MPLPSVDLTLPTDQLHVTAWRDPVIDQVGHDPRSAYVEQFWLPILGPTTTLLLRRVAAGFDEAPNGFALPVLDTAASLGLGNRGGPNGPFLRAVARAVQFKLALQLEPGALAVRRRFQPLTRSQVVRLPVPLQDAHAEWLRAAERRPDLEHQRRRARRLALSLVELGEPPEAIERQLHRWGLHPALAHEALRWARDRTHPPAPLAPAPSTATAATAAAAGSPPPPPAGWAVPVPPDAA